MVILTILLYQEKVNIKKCSMKIISRLLLTFNMKEKLCRQNSILLVIGYSGRDEHINKILKDCLNAGLTIYWYKFAQMDIVPFEENNQIIVRQQEDIMAVR